jgi:hypothetical protein
MPAYFRKRSELFSIAIFFGLAVSAVVFQYHGNELSSYFDLPAFRGYLGMYVLNIPLIRSLGKVELNEQRKVILGMLLDSWLSEQAVTADPTDLVEEAAWISLKKYWRPE